MTVSTQTVRDIALENPASIRVFESFGIDYCCGGKNPLAEACAAKSLPLESVLEALEHASEAPQATRTDWTTRPLGELSSHIVNTHHAYVRRELPRLQELSEKVVRRHGDTMPELQTIQTKLEELAAELLQHCAKEEVVLFPYVGRLERSIAGGSAKPQGCFGSVANPIAMMMQEHDSAGNLLAEMRQLSGNFTPPAGACPTFLAYYAGLVEFEQDLHQHIHLENNILFPRAVQLEQSAAQN